MKHSWWGFIDLCDLFDKFGFDEFIMSGDLLLESGIFLYFLIVGLEQFDDSCRYSP